MFVNKTLPAAALILFQPASYSQNLTDSVRRLSEVTVTANRYHEVIPSQRLEGQKLEALNSFSVADAIRYFSGIQIKDYGGVGGLKTVDIRSMGTNHMGVFYDGIQLGNAQNGQIDLGKFSLDNIEEISLYNGQKSEIFQPAKDFGSAGTIYLRTRRPKFAPGKNANLVATLRTGSFHLLNPSILLERKIAANAALSINAEYIRSSGKYKFRYRKVLPNGTLAWDTTAVRQNGDIRSVRLEAGVNGFVEQGSWRAKAYFYNSEKGIPGAIVNNVWKRSQRQWDRNFFLQSSFRKQLSAPVDILANLKYAADHMRYLNPDTTLLYVDNRFLQQEIYASLAAKYSIAQNLDINLSADYQWNKLNASLRNFVHPSRRTLLAALAAAFERQPFKAQASLLGTFVNEKINRDPANPDPQSQPPANKREYTPALFVSYRPSPDWPLQIRTFYKRIFRMPTFNDLYYTDVGNISLRPEYAVQYNLGAHFSRQYRRGPIAQIGLRADAYYNEVTDKIIAVPKGNGQYRWMMMNIGYVKIRGIDVSADIQAQLPSPVQVSLVASYTFQRAQDFSSPSDGDPRSGTYGGQIAYIPRHSGSAIINLNCKRWDANYSFIYVGGRYHNSSNIRENYEQPWYVHDLAIGKTFEWHKIKCRLSLEVNNLLNQYYDVVLNYPMPGRNYKIIWRMEI
jgi:outer membrane cobalamin receptor